MPGSIDGRRQAKGGAAGTVVAPEQGAGAFAGSGFRCRTMGEIALYEGRDLGQPVLGASKPVALLAYLALSPDQRTSRDHIAGLFWRSASLEDARHSLRQALYRLRVATDGADLVGTDNGELLLTEPIWFDCLAGEQALADGDVASAYELLGGEFLRGFSIPESAEFRTWSEAQHARFSDGWTRAAFELARERMRDGDPDGALDPAERLVVALPFDEDAARLLMSTLAAAGLHAAAVARYEAFADFLRSEDEDEPSESLRLYRDELHGFLRDRQVRSESRLPFVGRKAEWARLEAGWESAREGRGSLLLIEGAAGVGKTRLMSELSDRVRASGGLVLHAKCYELERTVPYAVMAEALAPSISRPELEELGTAWISEAARLLPELAERFSDAPTPADRGSAVAGKRRLHQALTRWVEVLSRESPVLLSVDDLHWADAASLEVLHRLATKLSDERTLVTISYRPLELKRASLRFARAVTSSQLADVIELEPLEPGDVSELLQGLGKFEAESVLRALSGHLHRQSGGNPLFLAELLEALAHERVLWVSGGRWRLGPHARIDELPKTIQKLMSDRIDRLDPWMRACAETLAVASGGATIEMLARVLNLSEPRTELALGVLCEQRLARCTGPDEFDLIHDEMRRLVYHSIPDQRRRLLHFDVGAALEAAGEARRPGGPARLAYHFDHAGDTRKAHRYAMLAVGEAETFAAREERRAHLELATAHSPIALAPGEPMGSEPDEAPGLLRPWIFRRVPLIAAGVALPLAAALGTAAFHRRSGEDPPDYRQGTIVFSSQELGPVWPTHRLLWPRAEGELGTFEEDASLAPAGLQRVFARWVPEDGESHSSLFLAVGADTARLTRGRSDDRPIGWSPDGELLLVYRGFRAGEGPFMVTLVLRDTLGNERTLVPPPLNDARALWMPSGMQVLVRLDSIRGSQILLLDADGSHARDLSEEFNLPAGRPQLAVSPEGDQIAALYPSINGEPGEIVFLDLALRTRRAEAWVHPPREVGTDYALWSPDGEWLVYAAALGAGAGTEAGLWALAADGSGGPRLIAELPTALIPARWEGGPDVTARFVAIEPERLDLDPGEGVRVGARVRGQSGDLQLVPIRWSTANPEVARVDSLGFVRGRASGSTILIASAGGRIADSIQVSVSSRAVDTLLVETWESGLQPDRWTPFGRPFPQVRNGSFETEGPAFFNSGDYNHYSGVMSRDAFAALPQGLTIEVEGWLRFTGGDWQDLAIVVDSDPALEEGELAGPQGSYATLNIAGPNERRAEVELDCSGLTTPLPGPWNGVTARILTLQIRPDAIAECWIDRKLVGVKALPAGPWGEPFYLALGGRMDGTELAHGRVVVTRGLRN